MIEINTIREKYVSMTDTELISFSIEEKHLLSKQAEVLLEAELVRRGLDHYIPPQGENPGAEELNDGITDIYSFTSFYWSYAFDEKEIGKNNQGIIEGLVEMGLKEPDAVQLVSGIADKAEQRLRKAELEKLTGGLIFICGLSINFLPITATSNRLAYIIACCCMLFGALKYLKGLYNQGRFKKILQNITLDIRG